MECLLRRVVELSTEVKAVLILILMECLLREDRQSSRSAVESLNPYSNGMLT